LSAGKEANFGHAAIARSLGCSLSQLIIEAEKSSKKTKAMSRDPLLWLSARIVVSRRTRHHGFARMFRR
jgi:hypothetical protein